jgi:hypothetical protein
MMRFICLLLTLTLVFFLCACENEDIVNQDESKSNDAIENVVEPEDISYRVGDYITFGSYEQDNNFDNGAEEIEWLILDIQDGKALVISKYALHAKTYNTYRDTTWEDCTLRQWLKNDFLNVAFSADEQQKIQFTTVVAEDNEEYGTEAGDNTQDKIFLLSISEAEDYFDSDEARECKATEYAIAEGCWTSTSDDYCGNCWWWLRSPGCSQSSAAGVNGVGSISDYDVNYGFCAIRPAMWIEIE